MEKFIRGVEPKKSLQIGRHNPEHIIAIRKKTGIYSQSGPFPENPEPLSEAEEWVYDHWDMKGHMLQIQTYTLIELSDTLPKFLARSNSEHIGCPKWIRHERLHGKEPWDLDSAEWKCKINQTVGLIIRIELYPLIIYSPVQVLEKYFKFTKK